MHRKVNSVDPVYILIFIQVRQLAVEAFMVHCLFLCTLSPLQTAFDVKETTFCLEISLIVGSTRDF